MIDLPIISNHIGKAELLDHMIVSPGSDLAGIPIIYDNGILKDGGKTDDGLSEWYYYVKLNDAGAEKQMRLKHTFLTESSDEEYAVESFENGSSSGFTPITPDEYSKKAAETQTIPINGKLEWKPFSELA